ncbi:endolytic transglycosylase MltG [bacterium]|nr:endolytic transglycosylase MltG [bacterium]
MRRLVPAAAAGLLCGILLVVWGWRQWTGPQPVPGGRQMGQVVRLDVPAGATWAAAADTLVARGLLRDARILTTGVRLTGRDRDLKAGLYDLAYGQSVRDMVAGLTSGSTVRIRVTIPEGWDAVRTARAVGEAMGFPPERFLAAADSLVRRRARDAGLLGGAQAVAAYDSILAGESETQGRPFHWCEGYLAPDTYLFGAGTGAETVAGHLIATQLQRLAETPARREGGPTAGWTPHQLLTLASIVEAEARQDRERPAIAAVYTNRLAEGWRLEADPTVAFALDKKGERLFHRDLRVDSAFNTYRRPGLPAGPIGNPGVASLAAAARPDESCRAMFFVSDGADGHVFSRTVQEHQRAVEEFKRIRSRQRQEERERESSGGVE